MGWEFNFRKGVKFHNGNVITADDVTYNADRASRNKVFRKRRSAIASRV